VCVCVCKYVSFVSHPYRLQGWGFVVCVCVVLWVVVVV